MLLIISCIVQGSFVCAFAEGETPEEENAAEILQEDPVSEGIAEAGSEVAEEVSKAAEEAPALVFIERDPLSSIKLIKYPYLDTKQVTYKWRFPYSDKFFLRPSDQFSISLAQGSLGLALSAFRSTPDIVDDQYETYLHEAGFQHLYKFGYGEPTTDDSLSGIIGMKKIGDFTLIAAVTCGQGYGNEWAGNLKVGTGDRHEGFSSGATQLEEHIRSYIKDRNITGSKKLWVTGMSRAAAIGNITAADMTESGEFDDVYAYLFGVPRTTKSPVRYRNIFNICGQYDPVAAVPLQSWGYERYGIDLYTPSQESETSYADLASYADRVCSKMEDKHFRNNPEINYQLHLILEFIGEFFPTSEDYANRLQNELIYAWLHHDVDHLGPMIESAIAAVETANPRENASKRIFIDYVSFIAAQHLRYEQRQVTTGSWDPDESLAANIALEHRPSTYVNWLFSITDPEELLLSSVSSRRITFEGNVKITVFHKGLPMTWIDEKGNVFISDAAADYDGPVAPEQFMMKNGRETVVSIPDDDDDYYLQIDSSEKETLTYYDLMISPANLAVQHGKMRICRIDPGKYGIDIVHGESLSDPVVIDGRIIGTGDMDFTYSPTVVMRDELESTRLSFLSLSSAFIIVSSVLGITAVLLLLCLLTALVHGYQKRRGHAPFSNWYVIVPHIIFIAIFAALTQFLTYFMFTIGQARAECAVLCVFFIFLLALRGTLRSKRVLPLLYTVFLLGLMAAAQMYYTRIPMNYYSMTNMILYFLAVILLTLIAIRTFRPRKKKEMPDTV